METARPASSAQAWVSKLSRKPLPVKSRTIQLLATLFADPELSLSQLTPVITADPAFTLHLVNKANQLNQNAETEANSVDLAISTLGIDHLKALTAELPVIKLNPNSVAHRWYFRSLNTSLHAASQAVNFCRFPGHKMISDTQMAALFYAVGHWALWRFAPLQMSAIKAQMLEHHKDSALAEYDVLGCTIQDISAGLIQHWGLSHLAEQALNHESSPDAKLLNLLHSFAHDESSLTDEQLKATRRMLNSSFYPVKLANWLALTVQDGWEQEKVRHIEQIIADFLKLPEQQGRARILTNCVNASERFHSPAVLSAAAQLLLLPSEQQLNYQLTASKTPPGQEATTTAPPQATIKADLPSKHQGRKKTAGKAPHYILDEHFLSKEKFQQHLNELMNMPSTISSEKDLYAELVAGLQEGLGLGRVAILGINQNDHLVPVILAGFTENSPIRRYSQRLSIPSLFKKMAKQPAALMMTAENKLQLKAQLPERFKACCHPDSFVLMSIFHHHQPRAFVYADQGEIAVDVSPFFFKYFKLICNAASKRLEALSTTAG